MPGVENGQVKRTSLDQLQAMLNVVLEHTAHILNEANRGGDQSRAIAAAHRLRTIVPQANSTFQDALDELEIDIRTAQLVLQRDILALRKNAANGLKADPTTKTSSRDMDIEMTDVTPSIEPPAPAVKSEPSPVSSAAAPASPGVVTKSEPEEAPPPALKLETSAPPPTALKVDTSAPLPAKTESDPEPTTAAMSNMDLDSLFAGSDRSATASPTTATHAEADGGSTDVMPSVEADLPVGEQTTAGVPNDKPVADTSAGDSGTGARAEAVIDLDDPEGEGDFSSFLPGLASYANADSTDVGGSNGTGQKHMPGTNQVTNGDDSAPTGPPAGSATAGDAVPAATYDDLMLDFDLGAFGSVDGFGDGDGDGGAGGGTTFDESFFNVE